MCVEPVSQCFLAVLCCIFLFYACMLPGVHASWVSASFYHTALQSTAHIMQHSTHSTAQHSTAQHSRGKCITAHSAPSSTTICVMQVQGRGQSAPLASWTSMGLRASRRTALSSCALTWPMSGCSSSSTSTSSRASRYTPLHCSF